MNHNIQNFLLLVGVQFFIVQSVVGLGVELSELRKKLGGLKVSLGNLGSELEGLKKALAPKVALGAPQPPPPPSPSSLHHLSKLSSLKSGKLPHLNLGPVKTLFDEIEQTRGLLKKAPPLRLPQKSHLDDIVKKKQSSLKHVLPEERTPYVSPEDRLLASIRSTPTLKSAKEERKISDEKEGRFKIGKAKGVFISKFQDQFPLVGKLGGAPEEFPTFMGPFLFKKFQENEKMRESFYEKNPDEDIENTSNLSENALKKIKQFAWSYIPSAGRLGVAQNERRRLALNAWNELKDAGQKEWIDASDSDRGVIIKEAVAKIMPE